MPGTSVAASDSNAPQVTVCFSNAFWGRDDAGVEPLFTRMQNAKTTCDEIKAFYTARAALEEEYSRKLFAIARKPLGSTEVGTLRASLDVVRGETESMGKQHALIAQQMKSELEEPLIAFAGGMKERRKIVQTGVERLFKTKQAQLAHVNKSRDKYEQDCLKIKGYLAQGHMVMGQEERKNKAKLEKSQINMAANSNEYESAVKILEETTGRWNKEWKAACDKFQDLEEERIDFTKSSLWAYANIASTVCVSDDASCEKIRLSLENCEVEKDITTFIKICGTGQEIPDPPKFINFCRGDVESASEASEDEGYTVAQFQRSTKPEFRSASPSQSTSGYNQAPQSELAQRKNEIPGLEEDINVTPSRTNSGRIPPLNYRQQESSVPPNYSPSQHGEIAQVPHNEYPTDGMTMYCRTGPPSTTGSGISANTRPSSRDDDSDYSHPSSFTSAGLVSGNNSPTKAAPPAGGIGLPGMSSSPEKSVQKKRSGFFSNSPFRRKSKRDPDHQAHTPSNRNTWNPTSNSSKLNIGLVNQSGATSQQSSPAKYASTQRPQSRNIINRDLTPEGEEPADPRASFQLNVGNNVFDVASPDSHQSTPRASSLNNRRGFPGSAPASSLGSGGDLSMDPVAQALADLKSSNNAGSFNKQASMRVQADRHLGVQTPAPEAQTPTRPSAISSQSADRLMAHRSTPPPAYDGSSSRSVLGVPQPAFTSREMKSRTENWGVTGSTSAPASASRPGSTNVRARSPGPGVPRAASPQPQNARARSPGPGVMRARSPGSSVIPQQNHAQQFQDGSPYPRLGPSRGERGRPGSAMAMEMQLAPSDVQRQTNQQQQGGGGSGRSRAGMLANNLQARPSSAYGGNFSISHQAHQQQQGGYDARGGGPATSQMRRERSKSMASVPNGRPTGVLHYARALYSYTAAIPEELSFSKGDILAVLRLQDDGWWEAEVTRSFKGNQPMGAPRSIGLVPSNYLQRC